MILLLTLVRGGNDMIKNTMVRGMEGIREEELKGLLAEVEALRARMGENARTLRAAESLIEASRTQLEEIKRQLYADLTDNWMPRVSAPTLS